MFEVLGPFASAFSIASGKAPLGTGRVAVPRPVSAGGSAEHADSRPVISDRRWAVCLGWGHRGTRAFAAGDSFPSGFSLPELLVVMTIVLTLFALAGAAVSAATSSQKKLRTRTLISKIDVSIASQFGSYAGRNVEAPSAAARGEALRNIARRDLPDDWGIVAAMAEMPVSDLTPHQRAYVMVWNSLSAVEKQTVVRSHAGAECLFLIVMQGGINDCLDCGGLQIDVGDEDADGMPEFLDAWGRPIGFIMQPSGLRLPPDGKEPFFSSVLPFDPVVVTAQDARGGLLRPLIVSAGPDGEFGLERDASPLTNGRGHIDNITNFDEEARR